MAGRGRGVRKPAAMHAIEGTAKPHRHAGWAEAAGKFGGEPLRHPPPFLTADQRATWDAILREAPPGLLLRVDQGLLTAYVTVLDLQRRAAAELEAAGGVLTVATARGGRAEAPQVRIMTRTALVLARLAGEMGFTPSSRSRATVTDAAPPEPVEDFFDGAAPAPGLAGHVPDDERWEDLLN